MRNTMRRLLLMAFVASPAAKLASQTAAATAYAALYKALGGRA